MEFRNEEEIKSELRRRFFFLKSNSFTYSNKRANSNFLRGMLFCLGYNFNIIPNDLIDRVLEGEKFGKLTKKDKIKKHKKSPLSKIEMETLKEILDNG